MYGWFYSIEPNLMDATNTYPCACQVKRSVKRFHINNSDAKNI
jgi:hypothetical protein